MLVLNASSEEFQVSSCQDPRWEPWGISLLTMTIDGLRKTQGRMFFYPRLTYGVNQNNSQASTWWLRDMSMLRLRDIEIGYTLPKKWIERIGLSNCRFYLKGSNLLNFSNFKLWDPELDTSNGARYPIMKSFSFGLDINF